MFSVACNSYPGKLAAPQTVDAVVVVVVVVHTGVSRTLFCRDAGMIHVCFFSCFRLIMRNEDFVAISKYFWFE